MKARHLIEELSVSKQKHALNVQQLEVEQDNLFTEAEAEDLIDAIASFFTGYTIHASLSPTPSRYCTRHAINIIIPRCHNPKLWKRGNVYAYITPKTLSTVRGKSSRVTTLYSDTHELLEKLALYLP